MSGAAVPTPPRRPQVPGTGLPPAGAVAAPAPASARRRGRARWLWLHRWLGLVLGLWFILLGLTGSALVFYRGLDEWADPRLAPRPGVAASPPLESVLRALQAAHPQRGPGWRIELPNAPGEVITARYLKPVETVGQHFAPLLASVDPVTLQVVANRFWGQHLGTWLFDLHYTLLLGDLGRQLVGFSGVLMLASLASGLWLWWPAAGRDHWRRALHFKRGAVAPRRVYDLHKLAGVYGGVLLGVLAFTGTVLGLPELVRPLVQAVSPLTPMPNVPMPPVPVPDAVVPPTEPAAAGAAHHGASMSYPGNPTEAPRMTVDQAVSLAQARFAGSVARWIDTPAGPGAPYRVRLRQPGEPGDRFPDTLVWLDSRSGAVLAVRDPTHHSAGDTLLRWMHPLHSGEAFGLPGRLLVCACGALPLLLAVTGWLRWWHKRRARALGQGRGRPLPAPRSAAPIGNGRA